MKPDSKIYVAGHRGLVGSALLRNLEMKGYTNLLTRTRAELDLADQQAAGSFMEKEKPDYIFLAAAKVGGIQANNIYPAEFIRDNLAIQTNVIHEACRSGVKRLIFLGSSCIYPKHCPQPIKEEYLLGGPLEPTNRPYAVAKIAGVEMCWSYNRQYDTKFLAVMPTNLYGPGDSYDLNNSHVIPALIRKFHEAKTQANPTVTIWGTGNPRREFLYSDDMADACVYLMSLPDEQYNALLGSSGISTGTSIPPLLNIGVGEDRTVRELAETIREVIGYTGNIAFDVSKPDGTPRKLMDISRLDALGWRAKREFKSGLREAYQDYLQRYCMT